MNNSLAEKIEMKQVSSADQITELKKELYLERELNKKLRQTQEDWSVLIEKVQPTIQALSEKTKELKENLHLKNQELTNVLQSLSNGLIVTDLLGKIQTFNRAAAAITGIEKADAIGKQINKLLNYSVLPEVLNESALEQVNSDYHQQFSLKPFDEEVIIDSSTTLTKSDNNEWQGIIINLVDITLLRRLEEEAERTNRLAAMGEIAMQVAHEIRNPLGSIELFVSMMKMDFQEDSNEMDLVLHIISATRSMNHIISNLLEYTKPRSIVIDTVDIHEILDEFVRFSTFSAGQQNIEIRQNLNADEKEIQGNSDLITQVFHNLFVNACQAMPEGGTLDISTETIVESDPVILNRFNSKKMIADQTVQLLKVTFEDSGKGMTNDIKKKIFDPFFTTREQGTGLGMSIIHKTMSSHGGTILVDSELNNGTRVMLLFPQMFNQ